MDQSGVSYPRIGTVWKVGSRWSYEGSAASSVLDIFRRHSVVFVGKNQYRFAQIEVGDLIAISDGLTVVALGLATERPRPLHELDLPFSSCENARVDQDEDVLACRIDYYDLKEEDFFYGGRGTIHRLHRQRSNAIQRFCTYYHPPPLGKNPNPLARAKEVGDPRTELVSDRGSGRLDAIKVAEALGMSVDKLAALLGKDRATVSRTPDVADLQEALLTYERILRLKARLPQNKLLNWLEAPNRHLDGMTPRQLIEDGRAGIVADLVEDVLTGQPT